MKKVLFCSPFLQKKGIMTGGVNIWGHNIISYYKSVNSDIELSPVSFDRVYDVEDDSSVFARIFYGIRDYHHSIRRVFQRISSEKIDVLHLCTSAQLSLVKDIFILRKAKCNGVKTAVHFHFGRIPELLSLMNWEGRLLKKVCSIADSIIVMDRKSYNSLIKQGFKNVFYLPNPLSINTIEVIDIESASIKRIPNKVLYVGHVIPKKGVYELVKACRYVDGVDLHLVGPVDPVIRDELNAIAKEKDNGLWCHLRGSMSHTAVIREMLSAGIFILPSYTEGFPNVILESMAASCAIMATNVGAIPEMLGFGTSTACGYELVPKDVDSIRKNLTIILNDPMSIKKIGRVAHEKVMDNYSMPIVWKQLSNIWIQMAD